MLNLYGVWCVLNFTQEESKNLFLLEALSPRAIGFRRCFAAVSTSIMKHIKARKTEAPPNGAVNVWYNLILFRGRSEEWAA